MAAARVVPLPAMKRGSQGSVIATGCIGPVVSLRREPSSDIGRMPLLVGCVKGGGWIAADIRVTRGTVGVRVLNRNGDRGIVSAPLRSATRSRPFFCRRFVCRCGDFILQNWDQELLLGRHPTRGSDRRRGRETPAECDPDPARTKALARARSISLETMTLGCGRGVIASERIWVAFRSLPDPGPISDECRSCRMHPGGGWVAADIRVTHGPSVVGVLNRKGDDFLVSGLAVNQENTQTIFLRLDSFAAAGDLILRNWDETPLRKGFFRQFGSPARRRPNPRSCDSHPPSTDPPVQTKSHRAPEFSGPTTNLPLESLRCRTAVELTMRDGSVVLATPAQQWAYAATAPLLPERAAGPGIVRVRLQVEQGKLGIGVLARDNVSYMLAEQAADITDAPIDVDVDISDVVNAGS